MTHAAYETVQTTTADPARLTLLLFDGAARFLRQSQDGLRGGEPGAFAYPLSRAHAIIAELAASLDYEKGGEIALNLGRLYDFMLRHLTEGLMAKSGSHVSRVLGLLQEVRAAFEQAIRAAGHEPA
jgi:flagellar secretion chaperone FliS